MTYFHTSFIDEFELLRTLALGRMRLPGLSAAVDDVDSLGRLLSTLWLGTGESTVTGSNSAESSLTPLELTRSALLDPLDGMHRVLASGWAVTLDLPGTLHHATSSIALWASRPPTAPI